MQLEIKTVKISEIKPNPDNPRTIKGQDMDRLVKSLRDFPDMMQIREIVCDENLTVLGGNMRYQALKKSGAKECTAKIVKGLSDAQKREFIIKDNAAFGEWNMEGLANEWADLPLAEWGVDLPEDWLTPETTEPADAEPQIDRAEELNKIWKCETGQLWQIGQHRLLVGDSTKAEDVKRVMGGERADLWIADPPYGIEFEGSNASTIKWDGIEGDKDILVAGAIINQIKDDQDAVIFGANCFPSLLPFRGRWICWDKRLSEDADRMLGSPFELAWMNKKSGFDVMIRVLHGGAVNADGGRRFHPTQKPVELYSWIIEKVYNALSIYDPCLGSGTTMVSAENLKRRCFGIEISENYCAVILERMKTAFPTLEIKKL